MWSQCPIEFNFNTFMKRVWMWIKRMNFCIGRTALFVQDKLRSFTIHAYSQSEIFCEGRILRREILIFFVQIQDTIMLLETDMVMQIAFSGPTKNSSNMSRLFPCRLIWVVLLVLQVCLTSNKTLSTSFAYIWVIF